MPPTDTSDKGLESLIMLHMTGVDGLTAEAEDPYRTSGEDPVAAAAAKAGGSGWVAGYPRALKLGLPIGSGMIESGHRHVPQARLKTAGAAWLHDHPDQIAHLRVLRANHQ